jgi:hypothetical protein
MKKTSAQACSKWFSHSIHSPTTQTLWESKLEAKERRVASLECLGAILAECLSQWNEWATVRNEERGIYTPRQNLTVQIYVGSSDADLRTSDVWRKQCSHKVKKHCTKDNVGTSDLCRDCWPLGLPMQQSAERADGPGIATPGEGRDYWPSGLLTQVGTSDVLSHLTG